MVVSASFMACTNDDEPIAPIEDELEVYHSIYVSEAEQDDYKNTYDYEKVDGKIRLKQINLFKSGVEKYQIIMKYDNQNRLVECKRSILLTDYRYHDNRIFADAIFSNCMILYGSNQIIITNKDNASEVRTYNLGSDGFAKEISWICGDESWERTFIRKDNDFVSIEQIYSSGNTSRESAFVSMFDDKKSIDYLRVMLPCLYSKNNILKVTEDSEGKNISETVYAYEYSSLNYPVVIIQKETKLVDGKEEITRSTTHFKFINASHIK